MQRCTGFLLLALILCAALSETLGLVFSAKDKRGWTLNSAGYLLGPHAVDNHRSFNDKHGFTGKREIPPDEDVKAGNLGRPVADENIVRTIIEFLTYLHLKGGFIFCIPGMFLLIVFGIICIHPRKIMLITENRWEHLTSYLHQRK